VRGAVEAVLLDIEGTTTPMAFVHDVLFPFARTHLTEFLNDERETPRVRELLAALQAEHAADDAAGEKPPQWRDATLQDRVASADAYLRWLMDRDRKSPALKQLQGWIWERGYRAGRLEGQIFADVAPAIRRWRAAGRDVAIYSSGSELAQRLLFGSTPQGDLAALMTGFFDTAVGAKTSVASYARIARALKRDPAAVLFVSDVTAELAAARAAGLQVALAIRPGNPPQEHSDQYEHVRSFDELSEPMERPPLRPADGPPG
jgi:enolase-phosphatase E1